MNIIEKFIKVLERYMDNLSIKKKFIQLYIFCVLLPLIITDSVVLYIEDSMESLRIIMRNIRISFRIRRWKTYSA